MCQKEEFPVQKPMCSENILTMQKNDNKCPYLNGEMAKLERNLVETHKEHN